METASSYYELYKKYRVLKDEKKAFEFYKLACEQKNVNAIIYSNLAYYYKYGKGCEKDEKKAFQYYKLASEQKDVIPSIYNNLAYCYRTGIGCEKNIFNYIKYSKLAGHDININ